MAARSRWTDIYEVDPQKNRSKSNRRMDGDVHVLSKATPPIEAFALRFFQTVPSSAYNRLESPRLKKRGTCFFVLSLASCPKIRGDSSTTWLLFLSRRPPENNCKGASRPHSSGKNAKKRDLRSVLPASPLSELFHRRISETIKSKGHTLQSS